MLASQQSPTYPTLETCQKNVYVFHCGNKPNELFITVTAISSFLLYVLYLLPYLILYLLLSTISPPISPPISSYLLYHLQLLYLFLSPISPHISYISSYPLKSPQISSYASKQGSPGVHTGYFWLCSNLTVGGGETLQDMAANRAAAKHFFPHGDAETCCYSAGGSLFLTPEYRGLN